MGQSFFEIIPMKSAGILLPSGTSLSKLLMEILWKLKLYIEGLILFLWVILLEKSEGIANIIADWKLRDDRSLGLGYVLIRVSTFIAFMLIFASVSKMPL